MNLLQVRLRYVRPRMEHVCSGIDLSKPDQGSRKGMNLNFIIVVS